MVTWSFPSLPFCRRRSLNLYNNSFGDTLDGPFRAGTLHLRGPIHSSRVRVGCYFRGLQNFSEVKGSFGGSVTFETDSTL